MSKHRKLSASGSSRWLLCPGSIKLSEGIPRKDTSYSLEGTAAHELGELSLKGSKEPQQLLGHTLETKSLDGKPFIVTQEMIDAVTVYTDYVKARLAECGKPQLFVENKSTLNWLIPESGGTCDAIVYDSQKCVLNIVDYKHGAGVAVYPEHNTQLMIYALGAAYDISKAYGKGAPIVEFFESIEITIVQPRISADELTQTWTIKPKDLMAWAHNVLVPGAYRALSNGAMLVSGEKQCRFCAALATCPEQTKDALAIAKTDFDDPIFPVAENMTPQDISKLLVFSERFANWANEVKTFAFNQLSSGKKVDGWKLVAKRSNRKWVDPAEAEKALTTLTEHPYEPLKLLSPAKAEKYLKVLGHNPKALASLIYKPDAGVTMARDTDKRAEIAAPAMSDFEDTAPLGLVKDMNKEPMAAFIFDPEPAKKAVEVPGGLNFLS